MVGGSLALIKNWLKEPKRYCGRSRNNCSRIDAVQSYNHAVANDDERKPGGIKIGLIRNQSWDAAKIIGAVPYLDYEIVAAVEEINANQGDDHRSLAESYVTALFSVILQDLFVANIMFGRLFLF